jgi:hypothetical protein
MILDKEVDIIINSSNFKFYSHFFENLKVGQKFKISIDKIYENSHAIINVNCDFCFINKKVKYFYYFQKTNKLSDFYYCINCSKIKTKKTNLIKYGCENVFQNESIKNKSKIKKIEKYGVSNYTNRKKCAETLVKKSDLEKEIIKNKKEQTCLKNYGVSNPSQSEKIKKKKEITSLKNNGCKYIMQSDFGKLNFNKAMRKNWGVDFPNQSSDLFEKSQINSKKIKFHEKTGLYYRASYEAHFLDYCFENNINLEKPKSIKYKFEDKKRTYHPDFFLKEKNLIIEIKSTYTYNKDLNKNIAKKKACLEHGFNFIFVIDKDYKEFINLIK